MGCSIYSHAEGGYCCCQIYMHAPHTQLNALLRNVIVICIWKRHSCCILQLLLILLLLLRVNLNLRWCKSNLLYKVQVGIPAVQGIPQHNSLSVHQACRGTSASITQASVAQLWVTVSTLGNSCMLTRLACVPNTGRASHSCSCSWQRSRDTADSSFCGR